jgi:hypothetical protein
VQPFLPRPLDERRHQAGADRWWAERFAFEVIHTDLWLITEFTLFPRLNTMWFVAACHRPEQPVVLCKDLEVPLPTVPSVLEIRSQALWSHAICEDPFQHWTVAMEAYALALDNSAYERPLADEIGERVGLAFDLEWEACASPLGIDGDYSVQANVFGELQVGDDVVGVGAYLGSWSHRWGTFDPSWDVGSADSSTQTGSTVRPASPDLSMRKRAFSDTVRWAVHGPKGQYVVTRNKRLT